MKILHTDKVSDPDSHREEPIEFEEPEVMPDKKGSSSTLWIIAMLVLIAAVTIAIYYFNRKDDEK